MKRLTCPAQGYCEMYCEEYGHCFGEPETCKFSKEVQMYERLKEYETTGLTPEICANYKKFEDEAISKGVTFRRIVELMNADKDGRLVVLPCKVGDTVFAVGGHIVECYIMEAYFDDKQDTEYMVSFGCGYIEQGAEFARDVRLIVGSNPIVASGVVAESGDKDVSKAPTSAKPYSTPARKLRGRWRLLTEMQRPPYPMKDKPCMTGSWRG